MTFDFQWRGDLRTQSAACCSMQVSDVVFIRVVCVHACTCVDLLSTIHAGYWFDPNGLLRLPGLFFGGFWGNMAAALFCFLTNTGFIATGETNFLIVYFAICAVMIFIVCASLKKKAANKSKQK